MEYLDNLVGKTIKVFHSDSLWNSNAIIEKTEKKGKYVLKLWPSLKHIQLSKRISPKHLCHLIGNNYILHVRKRKNDNILKHYGVYSTNV